ncbi:MAG TPA: amidohydrolase family protein [Pseudonocardiaceae bacterium]|nr:amidohydrolase family protein [Pseudonocardiaceae bacterium]
MIDGDRLFLDPASTADVLSDGGWIVPGLVDVHTHPGAETPTDTFDDELLRRHLADHRAAGVLLVRTPGSAARIPDWAHDEPDLPRVQSAGPWLATPGRFFPGGGRDVSEAGLVAAAVEEATASTGWCKVIGDWRPDEPPVPLDVLSAVVSEVHAVGGRVAVHCQTADGCRTAVLAGVDSIEHGMHLDPALLDRMAAQDTAVVPTLTAFAPISERLRGQEPGLMRDWLVSGWDGLLTMVTAAHEAGVTVLAGTDSAPFGNVVSEVAWLVKAGLPAEIALGAASWTARSWLGVPGLVDGASADLVVYDADPTIDPGVLAHPSRIVLRGRVVR